MTPRRRHINDTASPMPTIDFITMGCSKNLVDSENLMALAEDRGFCCTHDSDNPNGEIVVINTCGFINDAKEESINKILEFAQAKTEGRIKRLYVMGCLSERYLADLEEEIPEVDAWYGKFNFRKLLDDIGPLAGPQATRDTEKSSEANAPVLSTLRHLTTPSHYAYLKISEGCDRHCAYCAIPIITGRHTSRPMEEIVSEVEMLVKKGVKEIQVIAQELTYYGVDLYGEQRIAELVERIADVRGVEWVRLHYAYPSHFPYDLLRVMRERPNVCKYLDIALQHISDNMLTAMQRHVSKQQTIDLIKRIRKEVPGICLRTTLMVGFPGESDDDFNELIDFVKWARFERMGAFAYSHEDGTPAFQHFEDNVAEETKQKRLDKLMRIQQNISSQITDGLVGKTLRVIVDRREGQYYIGRTEWSSPEVDPEVLIPAKGKRLRIGQFYDVSIDDCDEFDLYGNTVTTDSKQ